MDDADRICFNISALRRYQHVGAIGSSIVLEYQGNVSNSTPNISGINSDGTAIASKVAVEHKADMSKSDMYYPPSIPAILRADYGKPVVVHRLNKPEIARLISEDTGYGRELSREEVRSNKLDASFRDSFCHAEKALNIAT